MIWIMVNDICDLFKTFFYEVFVWGCRLTKNLIIHLQGDPICPFEVPVVFGLGILFCEVYHKVKVDEEDNELLHL